MQTQDTCRKLCKLSTFLNHASKELDNVASHVEQKKIKMSVRDLALKVKQYKCELNSQIAMLNLKCSLGRNIHKEAANNFTENKKLSDKKIIELCCNSEVFFSKAYNSILNGFIPFKPLKDMLRYQLTGILSAFRQLKLLHSVMTPQVTEVTVY